MTTRYARRSSGATGFQDVNTISESRGSSDANKIASTGPDGRFHPSLLPPASGGTDIDRGFLSYMEFPLGSNSTIEFAFANNKGTVGAIEVLGA